MRDDDDSEVLRGSVRRRRPLSWEARVWVRRCWVGRRISLGHYRTEEQALSVLRALLAEVKARGLPADPLGVWQAARGGLGFVGEAGERLRALLPLYVRADGGWYRHDFGTKRYRTAAEAYRGAVAVLWQKRRRELIRLAKRVRASRPTFSVVADMLNGMGVTTFSGGRWTKESIKHLLGG